MASYKPPHRPWRTPLHKRVWRQPSQQANGKWSWRWLAACRGTRNNRRWRRGWFWYKDNRGKLTHKSRLPCSFRTLCTLFTICFSRHSNYTISWGTGLYQKASCLPYIFILAFLSYSGCSRTFSFNCQIAAI
jgi:hypothetical protein